MQSRVRAVLILVLFVGFASSMPLAHHSVSGEFDLSKTATLKGVISRLDWINPHIYVYLDVIGGERRHDNVYAGDLPAAADAKGRTHEGTDHGQTR